MSRYQFPIYDKWRNNVLIQQHPALPQERSMSVGSLYCNSEFLYVRESYRPTARTGMAVITMSAKNGNSHSIQLLNNV